VWRKTWKVTNASLNFGFFHPVGRRFGHSGPQAAIVAWCKASDQVERAGWKAIATVIVTGLCGHLARYPDQIRQVPFARRRVMPSADEMSRPAVPRRSGWEVARAVGISRRAGFSALWADLLCRGRLYCSCHEDR
jgi:hypothetical protein